MVGQYLRMRRRYDSIEIVGTFRAWKNKGDVGDATDVRDAEVKELNKGRFDEEGCSRVSGAPPWEKLRRCA